MTTSDVTSPGTTTPGVRATSDRAPAVRLARPAEAVLLQAVQVASGELFRTAGMVEVADNPPLPLDALAGYQRSGRLWVAVDASDALLAFVAVDLVDGCAHIEQVSVHPRHMGRGIGRRLLDHVDRWAAGQRLAALTLTTFWEVPWNGPYYIRCGFRPLALDELTPGLSAVLAVEVEFGLDPASRVAMRREVATPDCG